MHGHMNVFEKLLLLIVTSCFECCVAISLVRGILFIKNYSIALALMEVNGHSNSQ